VLVKKVESLDFGSEIEIKFEIDKVGFVIVAVDVEEWDKVAS
jgi:hypothetical protein